MNPISPFESQKISIVISDFIIIISLLKTAAKPQQ